MIADFDLAVNNIPFIRKATTPQPVERYGIVRFKRPPEIDITDDIEVAAMGLWWSPTDKIPPPREQKGGTITHNKAWRDWHAGINDANGHKYYLSVGNFICNRNYVGDSAWPDPEKTFDAQMKAEPVTGSGNIHRVIGECATHYMLDSISNKTDPATLDPKIYNWQTDVRFYKCAAQDKKTGQVFNVQNGYDCHAALLREGENHLWIWKSSLILFRQPPFVIDGQTIVRYEFEGASVFGITTSGNRIYLLKSTKPGERIFTDGWSLGNHQSVIPTKV